MNTSEYDRHVTKEINERDELFEKWNEENSEGVSPPVVVEGHPLLDPELNPNHPIVGRASKEKEIRDAKIAKQREKLLAFREKKLREKEDIKNLTLSKTVEETIEDSKNERGDSMLNVAKSDAIALYYAMGMVKADSFSLKKCQRIAEDLHTLLPDANEVTDGALLKLQKSMLEAIQNGDDIMVTDEPKEIAVEKAVTEVENEEVENVEITPKKRTRKTAKNVPNEEVRVELPLENKKVTEETCTMEKPTHHQESMSAINAAFKVLSEQKKALSAIELVEAIINKGLWKPNPEAKTPHETVRARITNDIAKNGKSSRFKVGEKRGTYTINS